MASSTSGGSRTPAISVRDLHEVFRIYAEAPPGIKERLTSFRRAQYTQFHALNGVSLDIMPGERVGLVGHNGSGKSTLLKCMAKILPPDQGTVEVRGRVATLLELGAGFSPELTGRENMYLNGSILGLTRDEISASFDAIVDFAGIRDFIDTPVKNYSSGMYVRLGFAIAVHVDPDILLVDEVLAVGDETFQGRSLNRMRAFAEAGKTVVLVSHDLNSIESLCDRVIVLEAGKVVFDGPAAQAVVEYHRRLAAGHGDTLEVPDAPPPLPPTPASDADGDGDAEETPEEPDPRSLDVTIDEVHLEVLDGATSDPQDGASSDPQDGEATSDPQAAASTTPAGDTAEPRAEAPTTPAAGQGRPARRGPDRGRDAVAVPGSPARLTVTATPRRLLVGDGGLYVRVALRRPDLPVVLYDSRTSYRVQYVAPPPPGVPFTAVVDLTLNLLSGTYVIDVEVGNAETEVLHDLQEAAVRVTVQGDPWDVGIVPTDMRFTLHNPDGIWPPESEPPGLEEGGPRRHPDPLWPLGTEPPSRRATPAAGSQPATPSDADQPRTPAGTQPVQSTHASADAADGHQDGVVRAPGADDVEVERR